MDNNVTYEMAERHDTTRAYRVRVGRHTSGFICWRSTGWRYEPTGSKVVGEIFPTLTACKASVEGISDEE